MWAVLDTSGRKEKRKEEQAVEPSSCSKCSGFLEINPGDSSDS